MAESESTIDGPWEQYILWIHMDKSPQTLVADLATHAFPTEDLCLVNLRSGFKHLSWDLVRIKRSKKRQIELPKHFELLVSHW